MTFGEYLKLKREEHGWTQPEAASRIGIEQSYLSKLETGKSYPSEDVFDRLIEGFNFSVADVADTVSSAELTRLRNLRDVRSYLLDQQSRTQKVARVWLISSVAMLTLGGASLGLHTLAQDTEIREYRYISYGVLSLDEPVDAFDAVINRSASSGATPTAASQLRAEMTSRLDIDEVVLNTDRGRWYFESFENGRRRYALADSDTIRTPSPLRWFFVPALAFLFGAVGCFIISFRWR